MSIVWRDAAQGSPLIRVALFQFRQVQGIPRVAGHVLAFLLAVRPSNLSPLYKQPLRLPSAVAHGAKGCRYAPRHREDACDRTGAGREAAAP